MKRRFFQKWKGTLSLGARTTLTQLRASWRPEKANFPNLIEIVISAETVNYPNLNWDAFAGRHNNVDSILSVLVTWISDFSEPERNCFFQFKKRLSESERTSFFTAPEQPWHNFELLGDQKNWFFQTWKNLLIQQKRRFFRTWKGSLFEGPLKLFGASCDLKKRSFRTWNKWLLSWKGDFSETGKGTLFHGARASLTQFRACVRPEKAIFPKRQFSGSGKSLFHGAL